MPFRTRSRRKASGSVRRWWGRWRLAYFEGLTTSIPNRSSIGVRYLLLDWTDKQLMTTLLYSDIKPSTILLTRKGVVKLCDFGVSGDLVGSEANTFLGTGYYMAVRFLITRHFHLTECNTPARADFGQIVLDPR